MAQNARSTRAQARKLTRRAERVWLEARLADAVNDPRAARLWKRARRLAREAERMSEGLEPLPTVEPA